jgi:hypothetical protein
LARPEVDDPASPPPKTRPGIGKLFVLAFESGFSPSASLAKLTRISPELLVSERVDCTFSILL